MTDEISYVAVTRYGAPIAAFDTRKKAFVWFDDFADDWPECEIIERRTVRSERRA